MKRETRRSQQQQGILCAHTEEIRLSCPANTSQQRHYAVSRSRTHHHRGTRMRFNLIYLVSYSRIVVVYSGRSRLPVVASRIEIHNLMSFNSCALRFFTDRIHENGVLVWRGYVFLAFSNKFPAVWLHVCYCLSACCLLNSVRIRCTPSLACWVVQFPGDQQYATE